MKKTLLFFAVILSFTISAQNNQPFSFAQNPEFNQMDNILSKLKKGQGDKKQTKEALIVAQKNDSIYHWHWDTTTLAWATLPYQKTINIIYDANNNETDELTQHWNSGAWEDSSRINKIYAANYTLTSETSQTWTSGAWMNISKQNYTYGSNNNITSIASYYWTTGWVLVSQYNNITYDANNNMNSYSGQYGGDPIEAFMSYDSLNNTINETFIVYLTYGTSYFTNTYTNTYDANNNLIKVIKTDNSGESSSTSYTYAINRYMTSETHQSLPEPQMSGDSIRYYGTDVIGCLSVTPSICMVTVDSLSINNEIYWDKTLPEHSAVDSFIVYRYDVISGNYLRLGAVSMDSLSIFTDTKRDIDGPNGGDPLYSSYRYKIAIRDSCGKISNLSPYHESIFVQQNTQNFSWNAYTIEGETSSVTGYQFMRNDTDNGTWNVLVNTAGLASTDPLYTNYPDGKWRVQALGLSCSPTRSTINKTRSNIRQAPVSSINEINSAKNNFSIFPNPSNTKITLSSDKELGIILIYNTLGAEVMTITSKNKIAEIDISKLADGFYTVNIGGSYSKLVKERK